MTEEKGNHKGVDCHGARGGLREMMEGMSAAITTTMEPKQMTMVAPQRVPSVDVLRGITIAFMILVNDPGDWSQIFKPLDHAEWNGWTLTDLVFPTFLFLMGSSMVFSLASRAAKGNCANTLTGHVLWRALKIFALDIALVLFPRFRWTGVRVYGVLTRIALCYLLAGLVLIAVRKCKRQVWWIAAVVAVLLVGYWVLMRWVPVPGLGVPGRDIPFMDENQNLTAWIDRGFTHWLRHHLNTGLLYGKTRDPEGALSTLPAVATTLLGSLAGLWMRSTVSTRKMQLGLAAMGVAGVLLGELWWRLPGGFGFPINKNLWTSSYVLLTAGWAAMGLAMVSAFVDRRPQPWPGWLRVATWPWLVYGSNAIAAFTVSALIVKAMLYFKVAGTDGDLHSWWEVVYDRVFARVDSTKWTSLAFALAFVGVCFLPNWWLWRKKWFLKI